MPIRMIAYATTAAPKTMTAVLVKDLWLRRTGGSSRWGFLVGPSPSDEVEAFGVHVRRGDPQTLQCCVDSGDHGRRPAHEIVEVGPATGQVGCQHVVGEPARAPGPAGRWALEQLDDAQPQAGGDVGDLGAEQQLLDAAGARE